MAHGRDQSDGDASDGELTDCEGERARAAATTTRCGSFQTLDGDLVLYDPENPDAWIQSSYAVEVEARHPDTVG